MKTCTKCNVEQPLTEFYKLKIAPDGKDYNCRQCRKVYSKKYYDNDPESHNKRMKKWVSNPDNSERQYQLSKKWRTAIQGVYKIVDTSINKVLYVGQSTQIRGRINFHKNGIKNPKPHLQDYKFYLKLNKHYPNVDVSIVEECSPEMLLHREQYYIDTLKPLYNTYK
jgi:hypothetical protein